MDNSVNVHGEITCPYHKKGDHSHTIR